MCTSARQALKSLHRRGDQVGIIAQNIVEFWCVATRPKVNNGLGLTVAEAYRFVLWIESLLLLIPDTQDVHTQWKKLVVEHFVSGFQVYDARLVAAMNVHGVKSILTFNSSDFKRYRGIQVLHPDEVLSQNP